MWHRGITRRRAAGAGLAAGLALAGCQLTRTAPRPRPVEGGTLRLAALLDAQSLNPFVAVDAVSAEFQSLIFASLTRRDPQTLEHVPGLADFEIATDRRTITYRLREVYWSDGRPITADDVKFTEDVLQAETTPYPYRSWRQRYLERWEAIDARTYRVRLREVYAAALDLLNITPVPRHIWEPQLTALRETPLGTNPQVFSGPFVLERWEKDAAWTLRANERYYLGKPRVQYLTVRLVPDASAALALLQTDAVDYAPLDPERAATVRGDETLSLLAYLPHVATWDFIGFNLRRPYFKDVRVRRALVHALDRKGMAERIFGGQVVLMDSGIPPNSWAFSRDVPHLEYNPARASALLREAGFERRADGVLEQDGHPLTLRLLFTSGNPQREQIAAAVQRYLGDLGIAVEPVPLDFSIYVERLQTFPFEYDLFILGWRSGADPAASRDLWARDTIPTVNCGAYENARVEELFDQAAQTFDRAERKRLYDEVQKILAEDLPYIFLWSRKSIVGLRPRVRGVIESPLGPLYNVHTLYLQEAR